MGQHPYLEPMYPNEENDILYTKAVKSARKRQKKERKSMNVWRKGDAWHVRSIEEGPPEGLKPFAPRILYHTVHNKK